MTMTPISDSKEYQSSETVCNNSMRNCTVSEYTISGKTGYQISISGFGIDIANKRDGVLSTCYITVESDKNEQLLAKWSNSKEEYTSRNASFKYSAPAGCDAKIRVNLKTADKGYNALVRNFLGTWKYVALDGDESEQEQEQTDDQETEVEPSSENDTVLVIRCSSGSTDTLIAEIRNIAPTAEISTLQKTGV